MCRLFRQRVKTNKDHSAGCFYEVKLPRLYQLIDHPRAKAGENGSFIRSRHSHLPAACFAPGKPAAAAAFYCENPVGLDDDLCFAAGLHSAGAVLPRTIAMAKMSAARGLPIKTWPAHLAAENTCKVLAKSLKSSGKFVKKC